MQVRVPLDSLLKGVLNGFWFGPPTYSNLQWVPYGLEVHRLREPSCRG